MYQIYCGVSYVAWLLFKIINSGNPWLVWSYPRTIVQQECYTPQENPPQNPQGLVSHYLNIRPLNTFIDFMSCLSLFLFFVQKITSIQSLPNKHPPNSRQPTLYPYPTLQRIRGITFKVKQNVYWTVKTNGLVNMCSGWSFYIIISVQMERHTLVLLTR